MKHRIRINVADRQGNTEQILQSNKISIPKRLLKFLFGDFCEVLVLTPGQTVQGVEIFEIKDGGKAHETVRG